MEWMQGKEVEDGKKKKKEDASIPNDKSSVGGWRIMTEGVCVC